MKEINHDNSHLKGLKGGKYIRCQSQEELDEVVRLCGDFTNDYDWNRYKEYSIYSPIYASVTHSVKGIPEISAKEFIALNTPTEEEEVHNNIIKIYFFKNSHKEEDDKKSFNFCF